MKTYNVVIPTRICKVLTTLCNVTTCLDGSHSAAKVGRWHVTIDYLNKIFKKEPDTAMCQLSTVSVVWLVSELNNPSTYPSWTSKELANMMAVESTVIDDKVILN